MEGKNYTRGHCSSIRLAKIPKSYQRLCSESEAKRRRDVRGLSAAPLKAGPATHGKKNTLGRGFEKNYNCTPPMTLQLGINPKVVSHMNTKPMTGIFVAELSVIN